MIWGKQGEVKGGREIGKRRGKEGILSSPAYKVLDNSWLLFTLLQTTSQTFQANGFHLWEPHAPHPSSVPACLPGDSVSLQAFHQPTTSPVPFPQQGLDISLLTVSPRLTFCALQSQGASQLNVPAPCSPQASVGPKFLDEPTHTVCSSGWCLHVEAKSWNWVKCCRAGLRVSERIEGFRDKNSKGLQMRNTNWNVRGPEQK